jgi:P2 family phage contractile tail tube protein
MSGTVPEKGISFAVYYDGEDLLGIAEGEFPNLEAMTTDVQGAGIAGKISSVTLGHFDSISLSLTWRNTTDAFIKLAHQRVHELYLYGAQQDYDPKLGVYVERKVAMFVRVIPKTLNIGKMAISELTDTKSEFEVIYLKLEINDQERIELDKYAYIFKVEGIDYLAGVRSALGKE